MNWIVSQIGARQHYGVPVGLHRLNQLRLLYTDAWCGGGARLFRHGPRFCRSWAGRSSPELPKDKVIAFTPWSLRQHLRPRPRSVTGLYHGFVHQGRSFAERVNRHLKTLSLDPTQDAFFSFNTSCLETLLALRDKGVFTVVNQIDPGRAHETVVRQEAEAWPGWEQLSGRIPETYFERLEQEWNAAHVVMVNSQWSRCALIAQGVPEEKIVVCPLGYDAPATATTMQRPRNGHIIVLWLGKVTLVKGIAYLMEAARLLERSKVCFWVVGPVSISREAVRGIPSNMVFEGPVPAARISEVYRQADVFVLPTLSDGFAITQVEAMAHGLPVVATSSCGEVVTPGQDGLIVPPRDPAALAEALGRLSDDRKTLDEMSERALEKARKFSLVRVTVRMLEELHIAMSRIMATEPVTP